MNHDDPRHGGEFPAIPDDYRQPATACRGMLAAALCGALLVILAAAVVFTVRGC